MKRSLLLCFLLLSQFSRAQKYQPIDTNTVWYSYDAPFSPCYSTYRNYVKGYLVNNKRVWHRVCVTTTVHPCNASTPKTVTDSVAGLFCNDTIGKKVYFVPTKTLAPGFVPGAAQVLFDFNLSIGSIPVIGYSYYGNYTVTAMDSIYFMNKHHKTYTLYFPNDTGPHLYKPRYMTLIEGVGTSAGVFNLRHDGLNGVMQYLKCFSGPSQTKYFPSIKPFFGPSYPLGIRDTAFCSVVVTGVNEAVRDDEKIRFFPNPVNDHITIEYETKGLKDERVEIVDISGRLVSSVLIYESNTTIDLAALQPGIYFLRLIKTGQTPFTQKIVKH